MTVLPVTKTRESGIRSDRRFPAALSVGAKHQRLIGSTNRRFISSWRGRLQVVGSESRLHVSHADSLVRPQERRSQTGRCRVSVHQNGVRLPLGEDLLDRHDGPGSDLRAAGRGASGRDPARPRCQRGEHRVEQLSMLGRCEQSHPGPGIRLECQVDRGHLDGLGLRANDDDDRSLSHASTTASSWHHPGDHIAGRWYPGHSIAGSRLAGDLSRC